MRIGIIGGTGREGRGLALRWSRAGNTIALGSRDAARAKEKASEFSAEAGREARIEGGDNAWAAGEGEVVILCVPYPAHAETLRGLAATSALAGKVLVDITVPLAPPKVTQVTLPPGQSAALEAQAILGPTVRVVASLHHVSSAHLGEPGQPIDCDVLVCGDDEPARATVIGLVEQLGLRGLDAGVLENAVALESLTPVLLHLNRRYKAQGAGIRFTGL